ncbi:hypothetical protein MHY85_01420 [Cellulomonas sp. ACRRI]|uniref:hypothetical protein n=1 Tax=Cellulomonas sp. ACRRI TaxID=2918188 RepID=UPI001EF343D6|nr:hypothetical protein [Cellulomonas sp. ACRRI]MCG7284629.1 hypothetical protein [Cellulomonas sp. ACRRI]
MRGVLASCDVSAAAVVSAVRRHFGAERDGLGPEWAALEEFTGSPGGWGMSRRADLFLVRAWSGAPRGHERVLVEVKVSRADLTHELASPDKLAAFARYAHRVYFATPAGLVRDEDLGAGVGLIEVTAGRAQVRVKAARRSDVEPPPTGFMVEAFRRASRAEARIRQADNADAPARVAQLERELAVARRAVETSRAAADRDRQRLSRWIKAVAYAGGVACVCGAAMRPPLDLRRHNLRHADGSPCPQATYGDAAEPDMLALARRFAALGTTQNAEAAT